MLSVLLVISWVAMAALVTFFWVTEDFFLDRKVADVELQNVFYFYLLGGSNDRRIVPSVFRYFDFFYYNIVK